MKKKIMIFSIALIILFSGIVTYVILNKDGKNNQKNSNNNQNEIIENRIDKKTEEILSEEDTDIIGNLKIESIGLNAPIKDGTELSILATGIGHFKETAYINGNICLAAHNRGYKCNFFEKLKDLKKGDKVEYKTKYSTQEYYVSEMKPIEETDLSVLNPTREDRLTMITCIENQRDKRLCVIASKK